MNHIKRSQSVLTAAELIQLGLNTCVIAEQTELPIKHIRTLTKEINATAPKQHLPELQHIIKTSSLLKQALLLVRVCQKLIDSNYILPFNIEAFLSIYNAYLILGKRIQCKEMAFKPLSINHAWVLVNGFINEAVQLVPCDCMSYALEFTELQIKFKCPFCTKH